MVALSVAFYARLSVGSRQIVEIFNILNEFMGNIFGKVPAYTTIGYWTQELGLSVYKESCNLFKDKRYALIVDESMMIGSEKLLLTLAIPANNVGSAITEKDVTIVDISIAKGWNAAAIKNVLEKVVTRVRDNILKSKEQKNIQPTKGGHKMVTCQNYVSLFYCQITSCPSDGGIS